MPQIFTIKESIDDGFMNLLIMFNREIHFSAFALPVKCQLYKYSVFIKKLEKKEGKKTDRRTALDKGWKKKRVVKSRGVYI